MACSGKRIRLGEAPLDWRVDAGTVVDSSERSTGAVPSSLSSADGANATVPSSPIDTSESHADDAGTACNPAGVAPDEVVWIGDSWFTIPGTQRTRVEELARQAGTLGAGESYENRAEAASNLAAIVEQYEASKEGDPPRVLIMDGGTWDTIVAAGSPSTVARVIVDFNAFLERVATDGTVQHLIYMLMPELPQIPGVAALRPGLMEACDNSRVPCHFLDLQPLWADHPEYTSMPDGIQASAEGATVIADQIWAIMRRECIAQ
jgi:hypothetical protein